jgi:hypothetical protein
MCGDPLITSYFDIFDNQFHINSYQVLKIEKTLETYFYTYGLVVFHISYKLSVFDIPSRAIKII